MLVRSCVTDNAANILTNRTENAGAAEHIYSFIGKVTGLFYYNWII